MHVPALLVDLRTQAVQRFTALAGQLLDQADDALFNLAQRTLVSSDQQDYLDAMRNLRKQRSAIEKGFSQRAVDPLALPPAPLAPIGTPISQPGELSLIAVEELEEQLAAERLAITVARKHTEALLRFGAALAQIWDRPEVDEEANPLAPLRLARSLGQALHLADMPVGARLVVLKLFERLLLSDLGNLIGELNSFLHGRGIAAAAAPMAQLRRTGQPVRQAGAAPRRAPPAVAGERREAAPVARGDDSDEHVLDGLESPAVQGEGQDGLLLAMAEIFANYFGQAAAGAGDGGVSGATPSFAVGQGGAMPGAAGGRRLPAGNEPAAPPVLSRERLLAALERLQHAPPRGLQRAAEDRELELGELLKTELLVEVQRDGGGSGQRLAGSDEQALTLVGMLFDVLLDQGHFSADMRRRLVQALPAYAQVALLDQQLFAHRSHPARRLLNGIAEACDGNHGETTAERELLLRVNAVIDRLAREFRGDVSLFVELDERFEKVLSQQKKRATLAERRTAESQRGRERLEDARMTASLEIAALTAGRHPPPVVDEFLRRDWGHHLTMVLLREGEDSTAYRAALDVGRTLWLSLLAREQGTPLPANLPERLREVSQSTGRHNTDEVVKALLALGPRAVLLTRTVESEPVAASPAEPAADVRLPTNEPVRPAVAAKPAPAATPRPPPAAPPARAAVPAAKPATPVVVVAPVPAAAEESDGGFEIVSQAPPALTAPVAAAAPARAEFAPGDLELDIDPSQVQPSDMARVRALALGSWVDLVDAGGGSQAAKLSWISPISQRMLFVNRSGARLCLLSPSECAALITQGKMIPRSEEAAFDRAMVGLIGRLRPIPAVPPPQPAPSK